MKVGDVIREYREIHGMSQRTFARRAGLSNAQIAFLERGYGSNGKPFEPTFETLRKVARAMGTTAESLMYDCEEFYLTLSDNDLTEDEQIAFLVFGGAIVTPEQIAEVKRYAKWILERDAKK